MRRKPWGAEDGQAPLNPEASEACQRSFGLTGLVWGQGRPAPLSLRFLKRCREVMEIKETT